MSALDECECRYCKRQRAEIERLRATAELDAHYVGSLEFALRELLLCEIDDKAMNIIRRALAGEKTECKALEDR